MVRRQPAWIAYPLIAALILLLFAPALLWLVQSWLHSPYYSHGVVVPVVAGLLAWRQWRHLQAEPRQGASLPGLALMVGSLALVVWAMRWQNHVLVALSLPPLLAGILLYLEGWPRLRHWLFPLLFLCLMVPLPFVDAASPWLEAFAARSATALARLAGIAAVQQGGEIQLPGTTLVVGAPCSGLRSLVSMTTLAVAWIYIVEGRLAAKAVMLAAVVPLVTLSNILRIAILLGVATLWGEEAALSYYHDWSSPILFLLALGLLLLLGKVLRCDQVRRDIF
jgi:exosortase